jgi:hypothetical protein
MSYELLVYDMYHFLYVAYKFGKFVKSVLQNVKPRMINTDIFAPKYNDKRAGLTTGRIQNGHQFLTYLSIN